MCGGEGGFYTQSFSISEANKDRDSAVRITAYTPCKPSTPPVLSSPLHSSQRSWTSVTIFETDNAPSRLSRPNLTVIGLHEVNRLEIIAFRSRQGCLSDQKTSVLPRLNITEGEAIDIRGFALQGLLDRTELIRGEPFSGTTSRSPTHHVERKGSDNLFRHLSFTTPPRSDWRRCIFSMRLCIGAKPRDERLHLWTWSAGPSS